MDVKKILRFLLFFTVIFVIIMCYPGVEWKGLGWKDSWQEFQQERRQRVQDTCSKYPELKRQKLDYRRFRYSDEYSLLFCGMGEVGSITTMMTPFQQMLDGEDWTGHKYPEG